MRQKMKSVPWLLLALLVHLGAMAEGDAGSHGFQASCRSGAAKYRGKIGALTWSSPRPRARGSTK